MLKTWQRRVTILRSSDTQGKSSCLLWLSEYMIKEINISQFYIFLLMLNILLGYYLYVHE